MNYHQDFRGQSGVVARIVKSIDGGPLRTILNGCASHPTGTFVSTKSHYRDLPWESKLEKLTFQLCEVSHRITEILAQPHRLEMRVEDRKRPLVYIPDVAARVARSFCLELERGDSFAVAALRWQSLLPTARELKTAVFEVKANDDRRLKDPDYDAKLKLAGQVYRSIGYDFFIVREAHDLAGIDLKIVREVAGRRHALFSERDVLFVADVLAGSPKAMTLQGLENAMGGGPAARAKLYAMHVGNVISIDLASGKGAHAQVVLLGRSA